MCINFAWIEATSKLLHWCKSTNSSLILPLLWQILFWCHFRIIIGPKVIYLNKSNDLFIFVISDRWVSKKLEAVPDDGGWKTDSTSPSWWWNSTIHYHHCTCFEFSRHHVGCNAWMGTLCIQKPHNEVGSNSYPIHSQKSVVSVSVDINCLTEGLHN